jgi:hypothetical protein
MLYFSLRHCDPLEIILGVKYIFSAEIWVNGNTDVYFVLFYVMLKSMLFYIYPEVTD